MIWEIACRSLFEVTIRVSANFKVWIWLACHHFFLISPLLNPLFFLFVQQLLYGILKGISTKSAVALQCFPSIGHIEPWTCKQKTSFKKNPNFIWIEKRISMLFFWRFQAGKFIEIWVWRSTKFENREDFFAFPPIKISSKKNKEETVQHKNHLNLQHRLFRTWQKW